MRFEKRPYISLNWREKDHLHSLAGGSIMPVITLRKKLVGELLMVSLPGIKDNRFKIELLNGIVIITFWIRDGEGKKSHHLAAAFPLAPNIDASQLDAQFDDEKLSIDMPFFGSLSPLDGTSVVPFN